MPEVRTSADMALPAGWEIWHLMGRNTALSPTEESLWDGAALYPWATWAAGPHPCEILGVVADTNVPVRVTGIAAGAIVTQTVNTDGAAGNTPVPLPTSLDRILQVEVLGATTGLITVRRVAGAVTVATVATGLGTSRLGVFSVPDNHRGLLMASDGYLSATADVEMRIYRRLSGENFRLLTTAPMAAGGAPQVFIGESLGPVGGLVLPPGSDLDLRAIEVTGVATPRGRATFSIALIPNS